MKRLALVLPCYNESKSLVELVSRVVSCAKKRSLTSGEFQLVLVENGSKDESWEVMQKIKATPEGAYVQCVRVLQNIGYGNGIYQGLQSAYADSEFLAWSHADEQCDPEDVFLAWEKCLGTPLSERTLVKGTRYGRKWSEWIVSRGFDLIASIILRMRLHEINAQPKVFHRSLVPALNHPPVDFAFDLYVLAQSRRLGWAWISLPVHFAPRKHGVSNWSHSIKSRIKTILKMIRYMAEYKAKEGS